MKKKLTAILTASLMCLSSVSMLPVNAEEASNGTGAVWEAVSYFENGTFEDFLTLSEEQICAISEEAKTVYEETMCLSYVDDTYVTFDGDYFRSAYKTGDYAANREMVRTALKLPDDLYWGMDASDIEKDPDSSSFWIPIIFHNGALEAYAEEYGYEELELAARLMVWMNLSPNVVSAYCSDALTGVNPDLYFQMYTFEEFLMLDALEMYGRPYYQCLAYVDALVYAQEHPELDLSEFVFEVKMTDYSVNTEENYIITDENGEQIVDTEKLFTDLYLTADWIPEEGVALPHDENTVSIRLNSDMVNTYLEKGCSEADIFARTYAWLHTGPNSYVTELGVAAEPVSPLEEYTYDEFLALGEEGICTISDEFAQLYEKWSAATADFHSGTVHYIYVTTKAQYMKYVTTESGGYETGDVDAVRDVLCIPDEMWLTYKGGNDDALYRYYDVRAYISEPYDVYEYSYLAAATLVWLEANPEVESVEMEYFATGGIWEPAPVCEGDMNLDGELSVVDVITIGKYNAKRIELNASQLQACDCNGDGTVNNEDVIDLMKFIVGIYDVLPVQRSNS